MLCQVLFSCISFALQAVAQGLGYCGFGLARLTLAVLGLALPKSKKVSMSNWELAQLSRAQVRQFSV